MKAALENQELALDVAEVNGSSFCRCGRRYRRQVEHFIGVNLGGTAGIKPLVPYRDEGFFIFYSVFLISRVYT
ncbi:hypothetical protein SAMN05192559_11828 [Halobacillus karajensis]|nr:hypothetical protein SAMN05192559_11828 [Halobacillus karajensis]